MISIIVIADNVSEINNHHKDDTLPYNGTTFATRISTTTEGQDNPGFELPSRTASPTSEPTIRKKSILRKSSESEFKNGQCGKTKYKVNLTN